MNWGQEDNQNSPERTQSERAEEFNLNQGAEVVNMQDDEYEAKLEAGEASQSVYEQSKERRDSDKGQTNGSSEPEDSDSKPKVERVVITPDNCDELKGVTFLVYMKNVRKSNELLWDAAEAGDIAKVRNLLDYVNQKYPAEIDSKALDDWTALHMAANEGHEDVVKVLLKNEANIEAKTSMSRTPLHISCMRGHEGIIQQLIKYGANINATDNDFFTPIHYASEHGFNDVVQFLLDQSPEISIKNHAGLTCIDVANSVDTRKIFEQRNLINEKTVSSFGRTCMDDSLIYNGRSDIVGKLLMMGNHNKKQQIKSMVQQKTNSGDGRGEARISNVQIHSWTKGEKALDNQERIGPKNFICHALLGKGSFGEVFLVEKTGSKKIYAMKVLRKDRILNQNLTRYAKTERNVLSIMNHPFIVKLNFSFQTENKLYLILDYCPGGDLGNAITKKRRFTEDVAKIYAAEITLALEALHNKDIIFRDLKPDNVVLDQDGHALLTDFGLSKEGAKEGLQKSFCGSIAYLAPEMLRRSGHNKTVDWYLLGVLIYEMLVGMPPYFSSNRDELFENIKRAQLRLPKVLSDEAKSLITNLLKRDPAKRLGAQRDAFEIKTHPWFNGINWDDAFNRKLKPPPIDKKTLKLNGVVNHKAEEATTTGKNHISGWSFINTTGDKDL